MFGFQYREYVIILSLVCECRPVANHLDAWCKPAHSKLSHPESFNHPGIERSLIGIGSCQLLWRENCADMGDDRLNN